MKFSLASLFAMALLPAVSSAQSNPAAFNISAQSTVDTLLSIANTAQIQIVFSTETVSAFQSPAINDVHNLDKALTIALSKTGLMFEFKSPDFVVVKPKPVLSKRASDNVANGSVSEHAKQQKEVNQSLFETILITGRTHATALKQVPISASLFSGALIEETGRSELFESLLFTPGVSTIDHGDGSLEISIRGVSTTYGGNAIGYFLDEVPFTGVTSPINPDIGTFDVNRIEVYRGPQGVLFGEGSQGGTIRVISNDPDVNFVEARLEGDTTYLSGSDESSNGLRAMVNVPVVDDVFAIRATVVEEKEAGYIDLTDPHQAEGNYNENEIKSTRVKARLTPSDNLDIVAAYWDFSYETKGNNLAFDDYTVSNIFLTPMIISYQQLTARVRYSFEDGELLYIGGDSQFDLSASNTDSPYVSLPIQLTSHEMRYSGNLSQRLSLLLGYYHRDAHRSEVFNYPEFKFRSDYATDITAQSLFGEFEYQFTDQLDASVGLRYYREKLNGVETHQMFDGEELGALDFHTNSHHYNPRLVFSYSPDDNLLLYANVSKGFRSQQMQAISIIPLLEQLTLDPILEPDSVWSYEVGTKYSVSPAVTIEGALYSLDWDGRTLLNYDPDIGLSTLVNTEGTRTLGLEANITANFANGLSLQASASVVDATNSADIEGTLVKKGDPVEFVSKYTWSASLRYRTSLTNNLSGLLYLGSSYASKKENPLIGSIAQGDNTFLVDTRIGVEGEQWGIYLYGRNMTNEDGVIRTREFAVDDKIAGSRTRPLSIGVEFAWHY